MSHMKREVRTKNKGTKGLGEQILERMGADDGAVLPQAMDDAVLEALVTTDLRENLPPQLLAVVAGVLRLVEGIGEGEEAAVESQSSKGR